jgi:hypothetical protein
MRCLRPDPAVGKVFSNLTQGVHGRMRPVKSSFYCSSLMAAVLLVVGLAACEPATKPQAPAKPAAQVEQQGASLPSTEATGHEEAELQQLVGKVVVGGSYFGRMEVGGWKWARDSVLIGGCKECPQTTLSRDIGMTALSRNGHYALVLNRILEPGTVEKRGRYQILGALYLGKVSLEKASEMMDDTAVQCQVDPASGRKPLVHKGEYKIIADAKFDFDPKTCRCQRLSHDVQRAWHLDIVQGRFTPIATKGLVCEDISCRDGFLQGCH